MQDSVCEAIRTLRRGDGQTKAVPGVRPAAMDALIGKAETPEDLSALFLAMQKRIAERIPRG